jgi:hypothetical protein
MASFSVAFRPGAPLSPATAPGGFAVRGNLPALGLELGQQRLVHVGAVLGGDLPGIVQHQGAGIVGAHHPAVARAFKLRFPHRPATPRQRFGSHGISRPAAAPRRR